MKCTIHHAIHISVASNVWLPKDIVLPKNIGLHNNFGLSIYIIPYCLSISILYFRRISNWQTIFGRRTIPDWRKISESLKNRNAKTYQTLLTQYRIVKQYRTANVFVITLKSWKFMYYNCHYSQKKIIDGLTKTLKRVIFIFTSLAMKMRRMSMTSLLSQKHK
jgi:hypothetical protein